MFDPHYTRSNHNRRYQKRGQIIQAKKVQIPRTIEQDLIPLYQEYFIKNYIPGFTPPQFPISSFYIKDASTKLHSHSGSLSIPSRHSVLAIADTGQNINIYFIHNLDPQGDPISISLNGVYYETTEASIPFVTPNNEVILSLSSNDVYVDSEIYPLLTIPSRPNLVLNQIDSE